MIVVGLPILGVIFLSFTEFNVASTGIPELVGFENFAESVLFNDQFYNAVFVTAKFVVGAVALQFGLGFAIALLLWGQPAHRRVFLPILLAPMFITWIAVGLVFRFLFDPQLGIVPLLLGYVGLGGIPWLSDPTFALLSIVIADVWQWTPFLTVLILAGLESLPAEPHQAARIDGASEFEVFVDVTLPLLRPVIGTAVFIRAIEATKVYPKVLAMTKGGPGIATESASYLIYRTGFRNFQIGAASSQAVTVTLMILGFIYVYWRMGGLADAG